MSLSLWGRGAGIDLVLNIIFFFSVIHVTLREGYRRRAGKKQPSPLQQRLDLPRPLGEEFFEELVSDLIRFAGIRNPPWDLRQPWPFVDSQYLKCRGGLQIVWLWTSHLHLPHQLFVKQVFSCGNRVAAGSFQSYMLPHSHIRDPCGCRSTPKAIAVAMGMSRGLELCWWLRPIGSYPWSQELIWF